MLQNPAYRHVILNHLPITGLLVAWVVLLLGLVLRERNVARAGLLLVAATAASALLVIWAGEEAYPTVYQRLDGAARARLDRHADLAGVWGLGLYATAALALAGLAASFWRAGLTTPSSLIVGVATMGSLVAAFLIADAGGRIRHPEFHEDESRVVSDTTIGGPVAMRRLNAEQYRGAVAEVFGEDIEIDGRFEPDSRRAGLLAVGSAQTTITASAFEQYESIAMNVAGQVLSEERRAESVACRPAAEDAADDGCAETFLRETGKRLFRRELTEEEIRTRVEAARVTAAKSRDFYVGLQVALASLLASPDFLFRIERTEPHPTKPDRRILTDETLASRLSYLLWNAGPDEELRDAAARGELMQAAGLMRQVDRMCASPRVKEGVRAFFADLLRLDEIDQLTKDLQRYPIYTEQMALDAREQTLRVVVDHLIDRQGDYRDLFTTRRFLLTRTLGPLYRVPVHARTGWESMELPEDHPHAGLLSHVSLNMLRAHPGRSSPTLRGKFIREAILCQIVPPAPADVEFALFNDDQNADLKTARERLEVHSSTPSCRGCHSLSDPIGLGLERFDAIGRFRPTENGASIDPSGTLDGAEFADAKELGEAMSNHSRLVPCLVETLYRYAVGRDPVETELGTLADLEEEFAASGHRVSTLLRAIALSETFRTAPLDDSESPPHIRAGAGRIRENDT